MCNHNLTPKKEAEFLQVLADTGNISEASRQIGITRAAAYYHRSQFPAFAEQWTNALEVATDLLEQEARRRALKGVSKPVFYQGVQCGTIQEYSDTLMIVLLKAHRPDKFSERSRTDTTTITLDVTNMTPEERQARIDELMEKRAVDVDG